MKCYGALILALVVLGCSATPEPSEPLTSVSAARARWAEGAPDSYTFDFQRQCFCVTEAVQPVTVEVRGGEIQSVTSRETGQPVSTANVEWYTIEDLFGLIEAGEANGQEVEVEYAPDGYPSRIAIGSLAADAGVEYQVENLSPL